MKITYIGHSGFQIDWDNCSWVFDYEKGELPETASLTPRIFFVSHKHQDHFNPEILETGREQDWYVLDSQIRRKVQRMELPAGVMERILFVKADQKLKLWDFEPKIEVMTLHSTDCGVAFLINYEGKRIYHAGDLNWWVWEGESKQESNDMTAKFKCEIEKLKNMPVDVAFLPLDPRQEAWSAKGMQYFLEQVGAKHAFPMHFWGNFEEEKRLLALNELQKYQKNIIFIEKDGQSFFLD
jgi:L-ascorbate metabolism protein UlaG (beta-lactamase superfamily)